MRNVYRSNNFKRDFKNILKQNRDLNKFGNVVELLIQSQKLPSKLKDHALAGNYKGFRELHIEPDWLLIYRIEGEDLILEATGTHSDLFG